MFVSPYASLECSISAIAASILQLVGDRVRVLTLNGETRVAQ